MSTAPLSKNNCASLARRLEGTLGAIEVVGVVIQASDRDAPPTMPAASAATSTGSRPANRRPRPRTAMLVSAGWVSREALAALPTLPAGTGRLDYVPLAELDVDPELVLLSLSPEQLMAVQAAIPALKLTGKPQCQIIPLAAARVPCVSLGCAAGITGTNSSCCRERPEPKAKLGGYEMTRRIRADDRLRKTSVVIVSASVKESSALSTALRSL
jgi:CheY-like chemotaxis protein